MKKSNSNPTSKLKQHSSIGLWQNSFSKLVGTASLTTSVVAGSIGALATMAGAGAAFSIKRAMDGDLPYSKEIRERMRNKR